MNGSRLSLLLCVLVTGCHALGDDGSSTTSDDSVAATDVRSGSRLISAGFRVQGVPFAFDRFHDRALDLDCQVVATAEGTAICGPTKQYSTMFLDSACSVPAVFVGLTAPALVPRYAVATDTRDVKLPVYVTVGDRFTGDAYGFDSGGNCEKQESGDAGIYATTDTPLETFVSGTIARHPIGTGIAGGAVTMQDGALLPAPLFDTVHDVACAPALGHTTCLPTTYAMRAWLYSDSACSATVAQYDTRSPAPSLALTGEKDASGNEIFAPVNGALPASAPLWSAPAAGQCTPLAAAAAANETGLVASGAPLPNSAFPQLTPHLGGGDRIEISTNTTDTGETATTTLFDRDLAIPCTPAVLADGGTHCIPATSAQYRRAYFSDAACTEPLIDEGYVDAASKYAVLPAPTAGSAVYEVGAPHAGDVYLLAWGTTCSKTTIVPTLRELTPDNTDLFALLYRESIP